MIRVGLANLAGVFLRLGLISFGGPAAHIALMREEFVRQRGWLSDGEFVDLISAANLIPGPNSTEVAIHVGYRVAGWRGLLVAGVCFILPAALLVGALAWVYSVYGRLPAVLAVFQGIQPVIIAVVLQALWNLGQSCVRSRFLAVVGCLAIVLLACGVHELAVLFGAGFLVLTVRLPGRSVPPALVFAPVASISGVGPVGQGLLFLTFVKIGSVLFGSGYVLLAFLRADFVERTGWLTEQQLLDAVAVGQVTPGPVFTTATFIGYLLGGPTGAVVATVGIFLPAFFFVALSVPILPRLQGSPAARAFLDGVNVASLALMAVVTWQLARTAVVDLLTAVLALASAGLLLGGKVNSAWLVLMGAVVGLARQGLATYFAG
ncbi:MAG: chromate efflux transporter [Gemmataceae bacterium]